MNRDTNPAWVSGLHKQLGDDWQYAIVLLTHVLGARIAERFADRISIEHASEGFRSLFLREALLQRGFALEEDGPGDV